jgi:hypothetical protein
MTAEATPLLRDPETPALAAELAAVEKQACATRRAVRAPSLAGAFVILVAAVAAVYAQSDRFTEVAKSARTTGGVATPDAVAFAYASTNDCARAFESAEVAHDVTHNDDAEALSTDAFEALANDAIVVVYARRDDDGGCSTETPTRAKTTCVSAGRLEACAKRAGVVMSTSEMRERYVLASVVAHAKATGVESFAYVDSRDGATRGSVDSHAFESLLASDRWQVIRMRYDGAYAARITDATASTVANENASSALGAVSCPSACACVKAGSNLCRLTHGACDVRSDSLFILHSRAYDAVLAHIPHASGTSALRGVADAQWLVSPPLRPLDDGDRASTLGALPDACIQS